ncbi:MAG: hypothetical protein HY692_06920 [Cyanobacteria bacterium NC_groundwater_1444_Ag_S-0.65um_54_12]|nr:hypothetical protein [Cyanobacteria bacterium NC_groundwater_1444_Ag_S-0.65um_54_12]
MPCAWAITAMPCHNAEFDFLQKHVRRSMLAALATAVTSLDIGCQQSAAPPVSTPRLVQESPIPYESPGMNNPATPAPAAYLSETPTLLATVSAFPADAMNGAILQVKLRDTTTGAALSGASIGVSGPSLATGTSDDNGFAALGPLALGSYEIRITAEGRLPVLKVSNLSAKRSVVRLDINLKTATQTLTGRVMDDAGNPLAGARLVHGTSWSMTEPDGRYVLAVDSVGSAQVRKTGFTSTTTTGGEVRLAKSARRVSFENAPFGITINTAFNALMAELTAKGWQPGNSLPDAEVRIWAAPQEITPAQLSLMQTFVQEGGKLVVMGDWGGASGYQVRIANSLLLPLGAAIEPGLLRTDANSLGQPEWLSPILSEHQITAGVRKISVLGVTGVKAMPPSRSFVSAPGGSYKVQASNDPISIASYRQVQAGMVLVLGDTSAWLDADLGRDDNLTFICNALAW